MLCVRRFARRERQMERRGRTESEDMKIELEYCFV
jgi:hypothetical protein